MGLRVYHRLYTHAPDTPGSTGGHYVGLGDIDVATHMPTHVTETVDTLLASLVPSGTDPAFAVRRFAAQGETLACLVVSYPNLVKDGVGRPGALTHARVIRVSSDRMWLDIHALLECAAAISFAEVMKEKESKGRVRAYVDQLEDEADVATWHPTMLQTFGFESLWEVTSVLMAYASSSNAPANAVVPCERSDEAIHVLASAWSALPIAMQISCSWTLDAKEGAPAAILFSRSGESRYEVSQHVSELVRNYLELLIDSSLDVGSILSNGAIGTPEKLQAAVDDLQGANVIGTARETPEDDAEQSETVSVAQMTRKTVEPAPQQSSVAAAEMMQQQIRTFELRFRKFVDDRLKTHDAARQYTMTETRPDGTKVPMTVPSSALSRWQSLFRDNRRALIAAASAAALGFVLGIVTVGLLGLFAYDGLSARLANAEKQLKELKPAKASTGQQPKGNEEPKGDEPKPPRFDLTTIPDERWRFRFKWVAEERPDLFVLLAQKIAGSSFVSVTVRNDLDFLMQRAAAKTLNADDRLQLRTLLFEFVARTSADPRRAATVIVDGKPEEITGPILDDLATSLKVESPRTDPLDDFMAEAVLRRAVQ